MFSFDELCQSARSGILETSTLKTLASAKVISAEQFLELADLVKGARRAKRGETQSASFRDLNGLLNRSGLGGILGLTWDPAQGAVLSAPNGVTTKVPRTQVAMVTAVLRAMLEAIAIASEEPEQLELPKTGTDG